VLVFRYKKVVEELKYLGLADLLNFIISYTEKISPVIRIGLLGLLKISKD
jgi:hypothetical protein